jgi:hypothetical protein
MLNSESVQRTGSLWSSLTVKPLPGQTRERRTSASDPQ